MVTSEKDSNYRQCAVSVMDNIADPDISFDENGICNYYYQYADIAGKELTSDPVLRQQHFDSMIEKLKHEGKNKPYDCITGISGGVDSSYLIYLAWKAGLRCLIVHFDNGWNSEIAVHNIKKIIEKTGFELYTIVVNWEEFRDLQRSYIKAGVVDLEVPTDHAILATWYRLAKKYGVKNILSGNNVTTEAILPPSWYFNKADSTNLKNIHKRFGTLPLKTFPMLGPADELRQLVTGGFNVYRLLNQVDYNKKEAVKTIEEEFGWVNYGGKHYESMYTKFFQAYILPTRFHIDKRKPHLSNLIFSGQITKQEALEILKQPLYPETELKQDMDFVIKKLGFTSDEFESLMQQEPVSHRFYGVQQFFSQRYPIVKLAKPFLRFIRK